MADVTISGVPQLQVKLKNVAGSRLQYMQTAAAQTQGQLRRNIPRKTSNTSRSIQIAGVTEVKADIVGDAVAVWIDSGTGIYGPRHHRITPLAKRALSWFAGSFGPKGSLRLTGRPRKGRAGAAASRVTVRSTRGMRARPYIARSVQEASRIVGPEIAINIVDAWNRG